LVQQGQVLAVIDTADLAAQLTRAEAEAKGTEAQVDQVQALISQRQAERAYAAQEHDRAQELTQRGVQSQSVSDAKKAALDTAEATLASALAQLDTAKRSVEAAYALVGQYKTQIADATLTSPVLGRVLYRLAQPGEILAAGGKVLTVLDLSQVYMEIFLPADQAAATAIGAEARIRIDSIDYAIPAYVSFVAPEAQFTPKQVETASEREKLMFRVKVRLPEELVQAYIDQVKTGVRGEAFIKLSGAEDMAWPAQFVGKPIPAAALPGN
jgi:HlyD family secretion protein